MLKIGSLNTRGLNDDTKLKCLLEYTKNQNYSIFGLSETKIKKTHQKFYSTKDYTIHWSSNNNSKAGVALIINNSLFNHHFKTEFLDSYIISSYFSFKPKITLCISQIYIPHDTKNKKKTINYIKNLVHKNTELNIPHIIMGDFNITPNPIIDKLHNHSPLPKENIYNYLKNYSDAFRSIHPSKIAFTYEGPSQKSRIDQTWISDNIITNLIHSFISDTNKEFKSDHKIISNIISPFYLSNKNTRNKKLQDLQTRTITT
jgi:Exonuclease III